MVNKKTKRHFLKGFLNEVFRKHKSVEDVCVFFSFGNKNGLATAVFLFFERFFQKKVSKGVFSNFELHFYSS